MTLPQLMVNNYRGSLKESRMLHYRCLDCQMGFIALAQEEAENEAEEKRKDLESKGLLGEVEEEELENLAYARFCPYCGGESIEQI